MSYDGDGLKKKSIIGNAVLMYQMRQHRGNWEMIMGNINFLFGRKYWLILTSKFKYFRLLGTILSLNILTCEFWFRRNQSAAFEQWLAVVGLLLDFFNGIGGGVFLKSYSHDAMVTKSTLNRLMKFRLLACYGCSILFGLKAWFSLYQGFFHDHINVIYAALNL